RAIRQVEEARPVRAPAQEVHRRVNDQRALERIDRRHADALAVAPRALASPRRVEHAGGGLIDDARRDDAVLLEPDHHGPGGDTADYVPRAANGTDDEAALARPGPPHPPAGRPVPGEARARDAADRALGPAMGLGEGRLTGFEGDGKPPPVVLERHRA